MATEKGSRLMMTALCENVGKVNSYLRAEEWLASKVPFMLGILLFFSYYNGSTPADTGKVFIAFLLYTSMFLAISYVVNDFSDIETDKRAGKEKIIAGMPRWSIWCSIAAMALIGNAYILVLIDNKAEGVVLMLLTYFLGLAYSSLGIRFKERGIWGLIECSFAQRCMPLLMIICLERMNRTAILLLIGWSVLSFVDGIRYIVIHQVIDAESDKVSGIKTYVAENNRSYRQIVLILFVAEVVLTLVLLATLWVRQPIITAMAVIASLLLEYCIYRVIHTYAGKDFFMTFDSVPLEVFLNVFFPVLTAVCLTINAPQALIFVLVIMALCMKAFVIKCRIAGVYIRSLRTKR